MTLFLHKKAFRWAHVLGSLPGVRAIFLSGSLATGNAKPTSDIDIFVIAKPGQIWTARFFIFIVLKIFNQLAKPHHHAGKICPNHFITEDSLEIQEQDAYAAHLFSRNIPLYDPKNIFSEFMAVNKDWWEKFGYKDQKNQFVGVQDFEPLQNISNNSLEQFLRRLQIKRIKNNPEYKTPGAKIVLTDTELRFHPEPKNRRFLISKSKGKI
jgi:predicted nucleotidyltransferase